MLCDHVFLVLNAFKFADVTYFTNVKLTYTLETGKFITFAVHLRPAAWSVQVNLKEWAG